jgi:hypothetical protein
VYQELEPTCKSRLFGPDRARLEVKISELSPPELVARLRGPGLRLETGPFVFHIRTDLQDIVDGLRLLYADFSLADIENFPDFQVSVTRPRSVRRWLRSQVIVYVDGEKPSLPLSLDQAFAAFEGCLNGAFTLTHISISSSTPPRWRNGGLLSFFPLGPVRERVHYALH